MVQGINFFTQPSKSPLQKNVFEVATDAGEPLSNRLGAIRIIGTTSHPNALAMLAAISENDNNPKVAEEAKFWLGELQKDFGLTEQNMQAITGIARTGSYDDLVIYTSQFRCVDSEEVIGDPENENIVSSETEEDLTKPGNPALSDDLQREIQQMFREGDFATVQISGQDDSAAGPEVSEIIDLCRQASKGNMLACGSIQLLQHLYKTDLEFKRVFDSSLASAKGKDLELLQRYGFALDK